LRYFPQDDFAEELAKQGLQTPQDGYLIEDAELEQTQATFQKEFPQESPAALHQRAIYFLIWRDYATAPPQATVAGVEATNARRVQAVHELQREFAVKKLPDLAKSIGWSTATITKQVDEIPVVSRVHTDELHGSIRSAAEANAATVQGAAQEVSEDIGSLRRLVLKGFGVLAFLLLLMFVFLLFTRPAKAQIDGVEVQEEGVRVRRGSGGYFYINFIGTPATCLGDPTLQNKVNCTFTGGAGPTWVDEEGPAGAVDGANTSYTLNYAPSPAKSLRLVLNGLTLRSGAGNDFTISGTTITMLYAPTAGSNFIAWYTH